MQIRFQISLFTNRSFFYHYVTLMMAQDAPKRRFLSLTFLVSWIYLACTLNLKVNLMVKNKRAKQGRIFDPLSDIYKYG